MLLTIGSMTRRFPKTPARSSARSWVSRISRRSCRQSRIPRSPQERILLVRPVDVRIEFVAADVERAHDERRVVALDQQLLVNLELLFLIRQGLPVHIQIFGAEKADSAGAAPLDLADLVGESRFAAS